MGSGRAAVVGQRAELGVNRRARAAHLVAVHAITDARATAVPDQVEARKDEPGLDIAVEHVRPDGSAVLRHEAVREPEKGKIFLRIQAALEYAAPLLGGRVARDRAVREREANRAPAGRVADAPAGAGGVPRDCAIRERDPGTMATI